MSMSHMFKSRNSSRPSTPLSDTFRVLIRVNPTKESCWDIRPPVLKNQKQEFVHDAIYLNEDNLTIYSNKISPMIHQSMDGYNMTLFAYGTTSSGKTHSIFGSNDETGIIPLALDTIFNIIKNSNKEYLLRVTFLEIYNEQIKDLLAENQQPLRILENKARGAFAWPLQELVVVSKDQCLEYIEQGLVRRHSASTDYNLHSSRSHAIFQIIIESRELKSQSVQLSTLNLIDLAGSEKGTSNKKRQLESHYINRSLLSLSKVISMLIEGNNKHIPYRDSKLTRILQTPLSGNALCLVLCCINPHEDALDESINTMHFATRLRKMLVKAGKTKVLDDQALLQKYRNEIKNLQYQLEQQPQITPQRVSSLSPPQSSLENENWVKERTVLISENSKYKKELEEQELLRTALKDRIAHLTNLILTSSKVKDDLKVNRPKRPMSIMALSDITKQMQQSGMDEELTNKLIVKEARLRKLTFQLEQANERIKALQQVVYTLADGNVEEATILALELSGKTPSIQSVKSEVQKEMSAVGYQIFASWKEFSRQTQQYSYNQRKVNLQEATEVFIYLENVDNRESDYKIAELEASLSLAKSILQLT
eukprot:NODE_375_length_9841_cov_0.151098.p1 type:complete len:595 gc:universal NODE_375_length_9841_cov_0.151098:3987-2203(-)